MPLATFALLRALADGRPHAAAELAEAANLPPDMLAPALADLGTMGLAFEAGAGSIRLAEPIELLDAARIRVAADVPPVEVLSECTSTNGVAADRATHGASNGSTVACEIQTAGRGRRGSTWLAPPGSSLAFSTLWRFDPLSPSLGGLSLAIGVAVSRGLERIGARGIGLKWPNDLLHDGRKLGGILVEVVHGIDSTAVIGIGLNVRGGSALHARIGQPITDLTAVGVSAGRNEILAAVLSSLAPALHEFAAHGFAPFHDDWMRRHAHQGAQVRVLPAVGATVEGRAIGVAEDGAFLVETGRGVERFLSGEVSVRAAA